MAYHRPFLTTRGDRIARNYITFVLTHHPLLSQYNIRYNTRISKRCYACWIKRQAKQHQGVCFGDSHQ